MVKWKQQMVKLKTTNGENIVAFVLASWSGWRRPFAACRWRLYRKFCGGCPFHSNRLCGVLGGVLPAILVPGCVSTLPGTKASQRRHAWALKIAGGFTWKEWGGGNLPASVLYCCRRQRLTCRNLLEFLPGLFPRRRPGFPKPIFPPGLPGVPGLVVPG